MSKNIKIPKIEEMLEAGVHFGHQMKRRSPHMDKFIYGTDNKSQVIDIYKTREQLEKAADFVYETAKKNGQIIVVGTKRQASPIVKEVAEKAGLLFISQRWLGGTFTNFASIKSKVDRLEFLIDARKKGELERYTKKERLMFDREIEKLEDIVGGIRGLKKYPDAFIVVDIKKEHVAVSEAKAAEIPVVALVDTNSDPREIDYPVPGNDDAIKSIRMFLEVLGEAAIQGYKDYKPEAKAEEKPAKTAEPKVTKAKDAKKAVSKTTTKKTAASKAKKSK